MPGRSTATADSRAAGAGPVRPAGPRRGRAAIATAAIVVLIVLLIVVAARLAAPSLSRPLVGRLAERWLRAHGADSSVQVLALSDTALTARVRLGDSRDPDLTIDRLDVTYTVSGPWNGRGLDLTPRAVRLVRPRIKARWRKGSLDVGQLAGLIDWARRRPATGQPLPDITIVGGQARLAAPGGLLLVTGDGDYADRGKLVFAGALAPFRLVLGGASVTGDGAALAVRREGRRLIGRADFGATRLQLGSDDARLAALGLRSEVPWTDRPDRLAGPAAFRVAIQGLSGVWNGSRLVDAAADAELNGAVDATGERQRLTGALTATARAAAAEGAGARAAGLALGATLPGLDLVHDSGSLSVRGRGAATLSLARLATAAGAGSGLSATATLTDGTLSLEDGAWSGRAALAGRAAGRGGATAAFIRRLVGAVPVVGGARPYARELAAALKDVRFVVPRWRADVDRGGARFALAAPARLDAASGAALVMSGRGELTGARGGRAHGAGVVTLSGGGLPGLSLRASELVADPLGLQATLQAHGAFDADIARGADARFDGRVVMAKGRLAIDLLACAPLKATKLAAGGYVAQDVSLRLCPGSGPAFEWAGGRWRGGGRLEGLRADDADLALGLRNVGATFDASGENGGVAGARLALGSAAVVDLARPARFRSVTVEGDVRGGGEAWRGAFAVLDRAKRPLARLAVTASPGGLARLDIGTGELTFAPGGLQPVDLTPLAAGARNVAGRVAFEGWLERGATGQDRSGGALVIRDLAFTGPTGPVTKLNTRIAFASLWPPATEAAQQLTVGEIASIAPLTNLEVVFDLCDGALNLHRAQADLAGGQMSLQPATVDLRAGSRFEGALAFHRVDLGEVLAATSLADQIKLQAIVDGLVPFSAGSSGVTIREGRLDSDGGGRLSISRAALGAPAAGVPAAAGGVAGEFAYQALENLAFDSLDARLNSLPKDRLGVIFHIKGRHDPPTAQRATIRLGDVMSGRAMDRPLALPSGTKIDLTLDTSLNFGELGRALAAAWQDALRPAATEPERHP